jgi:hypothetical protein
MSGPYDPFAGWLTGGGEMGERIRARNWGATPVGPTESWSPALRNTLLIMLANRFPQILWWGPELIQFYNDAYIPVPGNKHPDLSFARPGRECWSEIWHIIGPLVATPFEGGPATWDDDILLEVHRRGFMEEAHFTIAYSPAPDDAAPGGIGGVLGTIHEITEKVIHERRVAVLRDLGGGSLEAKTAEEACAKAVAALAKHVRDAPFALAYLIDAKGRQARFVGGTGDLKSDRRSGRERSDMAAERGRSL